jgi:hypothetical protein
MKPLIKKNGRRGTNLLNRERETRERELCITEKSDIISFPSTLDSVVFVCSLTRTLCKNITTITFWQFIYKSVEEKKAIGHFVCKSLKAGVDQQICC